MTESRPRGSAAMHYAARDRRVNDAIALEVPDRVPFQLFSGYFSGTYCGVPFSSAYYDATAWRAANVRTITELEPDVYWAQTAMLSGKAMELLGPLGMRWPGCGVGPNHSHQMIELEPMKGEEYDLFLRDPSDFMARVYLPRAFRSAAPMGQFPPMRSVIGPWGLAGLLAQSMRPEIFDMLENFAAAARLQAEWQQSDLDFDEKMGELGFPTYNTPGMMATSPFDMVSDFLRGMRGTMLDMYRAPDRLLEVCDLYCRQNLEMIRANPAPGDGNRRVFMALHRGSDGFMSLQQFETFYWPSLKKVLLALVDAGWTPCPFFEGTWDRRLEYLLELPRGKVLCHFSQTNPERAKAVLGGHLCLMIDVPGFLLKAGSVTEVEEHCRNLIQTCGRDGGFILTATCLDEANPRNVKAMIDSTRSFGRYD